MSYSNGLGNLQHLLGNLATNASPSTTPNQISVSGNTSAATVGQSADATKLSSASGLVSQSVGEPDVRLDRVASLQKSIGDGTYNVSAGDVATSIIASLLG